MDWAQELIKWIHDPKNRDQEVNGKRNFVRKSFDGPITELDTVGISNSKLRKKAREVYKSIKSFPMSEILEKLDELWRIQLVETKIITCYLLGLARKRFDYETWKHIDEYWIGTVDHWMTSDALSIEVLSYFPVLENPFLKDLAEWMSTEKTWRKRVAAVAFVRELRKNKDSVPIFLELFEPYLDSKNYYVRKTIPWLLREASKSAPDLIADFVSKNIHRLKKTEAKEAIKNVDSSVSKRILRYYEKN